MELTPIQKFYKGKKIFITGVTGLVGKAISEKLLRVCDIETIYVLVRCKKNKPPSERLDNLLNSTIWTVVKEQNPDFHKKIKLIEGDIMLPQLGLTNDNVTLIQNEINVIIHSAATIRFNEKLSQAAKMNILGLKELMEIAKSCKQLESFIYVSTAYSNFDLNDEIHEKFYEPHVKAKSLLLLKDTIGDDVLDGLESKLIGESANTYFLTKKLAENLIKECSGNLPIAIVRPSVIMGAFMEPLPGFTDQVAGPVGFMIAFAFGILRVIQQTELKNNFDVVPVDFVANEILAATWRTAKLRSKENKNNEIIIYNCCNNGRPLTLESLFNIGFKVVDVVPPTKAIWYSFLILVKSRTSAIILKFFLHTIPAFICDTYFKYKNINFRLAKVYEKLDDAERLLIPVTSREWYFNTTNTTRLLHEMSDEDVKLFRFDMRNVNIVDVFISNLMGLRKYIIKDTPESAESARKRRKKLRIVHYFTVFVLSLLMFLFIRFIYSIFV